MIILDAPYVSEFLKQTIISRKVPVLATPLAEKTFADTDSSMLLAENDFIARADKGCRVYSNSENAIGWVAENMKGTGVPDMIEVCKDKIKFRELIAPLYPDYFFKAVTFEDLDEVDPEAIKTPCVLKPSVGFFSLGVHVIETRDDWGHAVEAIKLEVEGIKSQYPAQVLNLDKFIIEQVIEGEEFAVDAYFDENGEPVVINILGHLFASAQDVSDRVYITSPDIIRKYKQAFTDALKPLGKMAKFRNFPIHAEIRMDQAGNTNFIEVNPMRFAGWCVTDIAKHAYGINPYEYFLDGVRPEWDKVLPCCQGTLTAVVVADIPSDIDRYKIKSIDYDKFKAAFTTPLELRPVDYKKYSVFAFMFVKCPEDDLSELKAILGSDLREFINME